MDVFNFPTGGGNLCACPDPGILCALRAAEHRAFDWAAKASRSGNSGSMQKSVQKRSWAGIVEAVMVSG